MAVLVETMLTIPLKLKLLQSSFMLSCTLIYSLFAVFLLFVRVLWSEPYTMSPNDSNPICDAITDNCDYIDLADVSNLSYSKKDLLAMQLNIRGLTSKQDSLKYLLNDR